MEPLQGRRAVVFGLAKSGVAAAELLGRFRMAVVGVDEGDGARPVLEGDWARIHLEVASRRATPDLLAGADLFVLSPGIPRTHAFVQAALAAGIPVWSEIELAYRCTAARIVAVTGSKGKSTTCALLGALLAAQGRSVTVAGNIGLPFAAVADGLEAGDWAVLELSSFQLESIDRFHANVAVHLGVSPDHLDRYPDLEAYAAAKANVVRNQGPEDVLVVHTADPHAAELAHAARARCFGFDPAWEGRGVERDGDALVWRDGVQRETLARVADVPLLGAHNVANAMAALAVTRAVGGVGDAVRGALRRFTPLPYRMAPVATIAGIRFVNDSKGTTVDAVRAAVRGLDGALLLALGGRNKDLDFRSLRPDLERVRVAFTFGEAAPEIEAALAGAVTTERVADLDALVARALARGLPGDTLLFSPGCTSFDMFRNAEHRGAEFDAAVARAEKGAPA